jgi:hypothetical protein
MLTPPSFLANIHDGGHSVSGLPPHTLMLWQSMAVCMECNGLSRRRLGKTRPQRHMRAPRVVVPDPLVQKSSQMIVSKVRLLAAFVPGPGAW